MSRPCLYSLQDFTINGSLIATATSSVPGDRKSSKSSAIHPPQPSLDTPTSFRELALTSLRTLAFRTTNAKDKVNLEF